MNILNNIYIIPVLDPYECQCVTTYHLLVRIPLVVFFTSLQGWDSASSCSIEIPAPVGKLLLCTSKNRALRFVIQPMVVLFLVSAFDFVLWIDNHWLKLGDWRPRFLRLLTTTDKTYPINVPAYD